ncbi:hypothetical protein RHMOL_Rhmol02G0015600 [Rhododendron molle]|uniref:Uncharacterized protein n=1 Tax=Rhododendron molle TaxID=49168 RepID=A0ACC0PKL2_RHOML|nr:hypothetical protein RHMOL_Rhmol02G0015600 [Rhododendron molle]
MYSETHKFLHTPQTLLPLPLLLFFFFFLEMAIEQYNDIANGDQERTNGTNGLEDIESPLLIEHKKVGESEEDESGKGGEEGSIGMVLLSTAVAVCGSFEFGSCVGYSAPTQTAIREDLDLSLAEASFNCLLTTFFSLFPKSLFKTFLFVLKILNRRNKYVTIILQYSLFGSIVAIGAMVGAITSGRISDSIGRKWGALVLDVGRFLTGYGIGIFSFVVPVFIAEIAPTKIRGGLATLNQVGGTQSSSFS